MLFVSIFIYSYAGSFKVMLLVGILPQRTDRFHGFTLSLFVDNMDDLLEYCFFCALLRMKKVELPLLTSTFFRTYLLPSW